MRVGFLRRTVLGVFLTMLLAAASFPGAPNQTALAADGDFVHRTQFTNRCASGIGVGIAFDGEYLWYSCYSSNPDLYKARALDGQVVASYNLAGGLGALAWDGKRHKIWAGWGGGSGGGGTVRLFDPATGTASVAFRAAEFYYDGLDDGLAYDASDDSLYISPDGPSRIHQYSTTGTLRRTFPSTGSGCYNSGLAIGGDLLYQGTNGCHHVWVVRKSDSSPAFNFSTAVAGDSNFRDEDLECDSVTFSPRTVMWSVEAYEPRRAYAFEVPPGSCATGGGVDSDGDGLLDEWERDGVTIDPDGFGPQPPQFIDLPAMGADVNKPDIFLQIDWMADATHSHQIHADAIRTVVNAFANSPYTSPTGSVGINLHVDQGSASIMNFTSGTTWGALSRARALTHVNNLGTNGPGGYDWTAFQAIKDQAGGFTVSGRSPIFHYVISAHNYGGGTSSGISRGIGASDLIVSLGSFTGGVGSIAEQAGTLMHELGHNLSLRHGGSDNANWKPNYLSIMNYSFQLSGLIQGGVQGTVDYSRSAIALNENTLSEPAGLGAGAAGYGTIYYCAGGAGRTKVDATTPTDWNCDGDTTDTGLASDVNKSGAREALTGQNDWASIQFKGGLIGLAGVSPVLPTETEDELLTPELADQIPRLEACSSSPVLSWQSPLSGGSPAQLGATDTLLIRFGWNACQPPDTSVSIRIRNAATNALVTGYTYRYGITFDPASGTYTQAFVPATYNVAPGTQLKVMVYFGNKLRGTALVNVE